MLSFPFAHVSGPAFPSAPISSRAEHSPVTGAVVAGARARLAVAAVDVAGAVGLDWCPEDWVARSVITAAIAATAPAIALIHPGPMSRNRRTGRDPSWPDVAPGWLVPPVEPCWSSPKKVSEGPRTTHVSPLPRTLRYKSRSYPGARGDVV